MLSYGRTVIAGQIIFWSFLAFAGRIFWNYLPMSIEAGLDGEITWGELRQLLAYLIRADLGIVDYFDADTPLWTLVVSNPNAA